VLAPVRRGQGRSKGQYIVEAVEQKRATEGVEAAKRWAVHLLETEQLDDQLAGLAYAKQLPMVDPDRIGVAGCSYGGI
jgi:dienelactone hydrolase